MLRRRLPLAALLAVTLAACAPREPVPLTPPSETAAPVVRRPAEPAPDAVAPAPPQLASAAPSRTPPPLAGIVVPDDAIYVCVSERGGERTQTVIAFEPKVHSLCRRHPEMGPCQYERNVCRASGGRVFAANGQEITLATEAEYDRKVRRVRFSSH
jgi:hypothetical protein